MTARPGQIKEFIPVDLPRPWDLPQIRNHPRFAQFFHHIWSALREEVLKPKAQ